MEENSSCGALLFGLITFYKEGYCEIRIYNIFLNMEKLGNISVRDNLGHYYIF